MAKQIMSVVVDGAEMAMVRTQAGSVSITLPDGQAFDVSSSSTADGAPAGLRVRACRDDGDDSLIVRPRASNLVIIAAGTPAPAARGDADNHEGG